MRLVPAGGLRCAGGQDGCRLVPLRTELQNGDIVEIVTSPNHVPSKDWLKIVRTPRARSKIRQWIKNEERARSISLGRDLLEKEIRRLGKSPSQLLRPEAVALALERYGFAAEEELFAALVILIVGALTFFPALALGPIAEHLMMS